MHPYLKSRMVNYLKKVVKLYNDVSNESITKEKAVVKLKELKMEQRFLAQFKSDIPADKKISIRVEKGTLPLFEDGPTPTPSAVHPLDFGCSCSRCSSFSTITMQDRDFLKASRIIWPKS